jgi:hypothetical protein
MQCKCTVVRIGVQLPRWFQVERQFSVVTDGMDVLNPNVDRASGRTGTWTEDEAIKLKDAVKMHGGKDGGCNGRAG